MSLSVRKKLRMRKPKWFAGEPEKGSGNGGQARGGGDWAGITGLRLPTGKMAFSP